MNAIVSSSERLVFPHVFADVHETPLGAIWIAACEEGLVSLSLSRGSSASVSSLRAGVFVDETKRALDGFFARTGFTLPRLYLQESTAFEQKVWKALTEIPWGHTRSYRELALRVGSTRAFRAVGSACGRNPFPILVPCHRVIRSDGTIGEFALGTEIKIWLLAHEKGELGVCS